MWKTKDCTGQEQIWYEAELINSIAKIAQDIVENDCYENSDVKAQKILELIQENEK